jgi:hypothetical protein
VAAAVEAAVHRGLDAAAGRLERGRHRQGRRAGRQRQDRHGHAGRQEQHRRGIHRHADHDHHRQHPVRAAANASQRSCRRSVPRARWNRSTSDQAPTARPPAVTANATAVTRFATLASAGTASGLGIAS